MGLDMYLYRESYVKNWDFMGPEQQHEIVVKRGGKLRKDIQPTRITYIGEQVAYWRKANCIHRWFVDNCQDGVDDCRKAYVEREHLEELVRLCKQVLSAVETVDGTIRTGTTFYPGGKVEENTRPGRVVAQAGLADQLLPTQSGFFFGSTDYDEGYLEDLRITVEQLEPLLNDTEAADYYYQSSW